MNLCFLIDNSITMSNQAYNGLSLLQISKSYIQKALQSKTFSKIYNGQPLNYHLFLSSTPTPLSTYEHQQLHFLSQLKFIQLDYSTDLPTTLHSMFNHLFKYRIMYQSETVYGSIDPYRIKPSLIFIFIDSSDPITMNTIEEKILEGELKCKYDSEVYFIRICPPCSGDKTSLESLRKAVEADEWTERMREMAEYWNGKYFQIHRFEYGFDVVESVMASFTPRIHVKFGVVGNTLMGNAKCMGEVEMVGVESELTSAYMKKTEFMVSSVHKGRTRRAGLPLPVLPPTIKLNPTTNTYQTTSFHNPSYTLDLSKSLNPEYIHEYLPHQKLELETCQLTLIIQQKLEQMNIDTICFPVYFSPDDRNILIGLLRFNQKNPVEFLIYMASFLDFNPIFCLMREKKLTEKATIIVLTNMVADYLLKIPTLYDVFILDILMIRGSNLEIKPRNEELLKQNEQIQNSQYKEKLNYIELYAVNSMNHLKYNTTCCPVFSDFYHEWSQQKKTVFDDGEVEDQREKEIRETMERMLELKRLVMPGEDDEIGGDAVEVRSMTMEIDSYNIKSGGEGEPLGNPYKRKKKTEPPGSPTNEAWKETKRDGKTQDRERIREKAKEKKKEIQREKEIEKIRRLKQQNASFDNQQEEIKQLEGEKQMQTVLEAEQQQEESNENPLMQPVEMQEESPPEGIEKVEEKELKQFLKSHQQSRVEFENIQRGEQEILEPLQGKRMEVEEGGEELLEPNEHYFEGNSKEIPSSGERNGQSSELSQHDQVLLELHQGRYEITPPANPARNIQPSPPLLAQQNIPLPSLSFQQSQLMIQTLLPPPAKTQKLISTKFNPSNISPTHYERNLQILSSLKLLI